MTQKGPIATFKEKGDEVGGLGACPKRNFRATPSSTRSMTTATFSRVPKILGPSPLEHWKTPFWNMGDPSFWCRMPVVQR